MQETPAPTTTLLVVDPLLLFCLIFCVTGLAGLAALLRSGKKLSARNILTWSLNSGLMGLGLFWFWQRTYGPDLWGLFGICILIGLGGLPTVEFVVEMAKRGVTSASINSGAQRHDDNHPKPPSTPAS